LIATIFWKPSTPESRALYSSAMPPEAIRSRISYCPKRSGPEVDTVPAGSTGRAGAASIGRAPPAEGGRAGSAGGAGAGFARAAILIPDSVSEIIRSISTSVEKRGVGDAGSGARAGWAACAAGAAAAAGRAASGAGTAAGACAARGAARGPRIPDSVSRRRFSTSSWAVSAAWRAGAGAAGAAEGAATEVSAWPPTSSSTSEKMSDAVRPASAWSSAVDKRTVRAERSVEATADWTPERRSSSVNGRTNRSKAPTRCASALRLLPL